MPEENKLYTLIREINVECHVCGYFDNAPDSDEEFAKILEYDVCPKCKGTGKL